MTRTATLTIEGKTIELPIVEGSEGEIGIDIGKLRKQTGAIALDPGFVNTGSCISEITFINGEEGILRFRGYPIEQLAEKSSFLEVCYLLVNGTLPSHDELNKFKHNVTMHTMLHEDIKDFFRGFPKKAHPMAIGCAVLSALSTFYPDSLDTDEPHQVKVSMHRLIAKLPTIAAYCYKHSIGQPFIYPRNDLSYSENFLHMMFATPCEEYQVDPVIAKALDTLFILHADHEQNCSTSAVRLVGSSNVNLFASVASGVNALWGPLHGGANQAVIEMLEKIESEGISVQQFVDKAKDKKAGVRLMGFGHRVYKNFDPRARIIKKTCDDVLGRLGINSRLLEIAKELEQAALSDPYFQERNLYPNVDFYSGIIYRAMNIPTNMYTVLFAMGRLPGWIAQWKEMHEQGFRIGRPRQIYNGPNARDYTDIAAR